MSPPVTNPVDRFMKHTAFVFADIEILLPVCFLLLLPLCLVLHALRKRLWLLPSLHRSRLFTLNASTLAVLGIVAKVDKPWQSSCNFLSEYTMLHCNVLICTVVGALMPSIAVSTDIRDTWGNVLGIGILIVSTNFVIFLLLFYVCDPELYPFPVIHEKARKHEALMALALFLLVVLVVQTMALEEILMDIKRTVSERLEQLRMEAKPGYRANVVVQGPWTWDNVELNTRIKLMMVLTSNPQNVMTRSPCVAIVGTLVLSCILQKESDGLYLSAITWGFGVISLWRWLSVAVQEGSPLLSLLFNAEPSYWRRKLNNFQVMLRDGPYAEQRNVLRKGQYGFKEVMRRMAAAIVLYFVIPFHWLLVAVIRLVHIFSVLFMQKLVWLPVKSLGCGVFPFMKRLFICQIQATANTVEESSTNLEALGVVCLEGEDAGTIQREFTGAFNRIIQTQSKKAKTKSDLKDLILLLKAIKDPISYLRHSNGIVDVLHEDGAPYVENLHVEHGYQYGWSLTVVTLLDVLTEIEVTALGTSAVSDVAINACCQAMEMMQVVDEQFVPCILCSKETYAKAFLTEWSKPAQKKKWRSPFESRWSQKRNQTMPEVKLEEILMHRLETVEKHMAEFNKARSIAHSYMAAPWPQQTVVSYTMHTVCRNLLRWWRDLERTATANSAEAGGGSSARDMTECMVEHINALLAEVLAGCLFNLPTGLDLSMTEAVLGGSLSKIEKGLVLLSHGKRLWKELQWPATFHSSKNSGLGQIRGWLHLSDMPNACSS